MTAAHPVQPIAAVTNDDRRAATPPPLVTVIIPTRKRAASLPAALDSVYAQRGLGEQFEVEVIVVDDASSDATPAVVQRYPRARYIRLPEHRGGCAVRNEGLRASTGRYVAFLDDDDVWLPGKLEVQVPALEAHPEVGVVYSQFRVRLRDREWLYPLEDHAPSGWVFPEMLMENCCGGSLLIRRGAFERAGDFDESFEVYEDYDVWLRLAFHFPFLFIPGPAAVYNLSPQGLFLSSAADGPGPRDRVRVAQKALAMLPVSAEYATLRQEAEACADVGTVAPLLILGEVMQAWPRLLVKVSARPWILQYAGVRRHMKWATFMRLGASPTRLQAMRELHAEIRAAAQRNYPGSRPARDSCAALWAAVASYLADDPRVRREAAYAVASSLVYRPLPAHPLDTLRLISRVLPGNRMRAALWRLVTSAVPIARKVVSRVKRTSARVGPVPDQAPRR